MKNIIKSFLIAFVAVGIFSCEDNEKYPLPATVDGSFVTIEFDNLILDVTDLDNTAITGVLKAPVPNVASYELQVARSTGGVLSDYVTVYTTDTFPANFSIDLEDLSGALGLEVADFGAGDRFDFQAKSTSTDGSVTDFSLINPDLQAEPGQLQSYQFTSFISCPFNTEEALGTYTFTNCGFGACAGNQFEVVAGTDPNTVVLINPYDSSPLNAGDDPFEITIVVNPATGIGSIAQQRAFSTLEYCCGGFEDTEIQADSGFYFSCTGTILFTARTIVPQTGTGALFTFGNRAFEAQKN
jgi:hypothetical protein